MLPLGLAGVGLVLWLAVLWLSVRVVRAVPPVRALPPPPPWGALAWPLGTVCVAALMAAGGVGAWRRQGIVWRGTFYPRAVVEAGRRLARQPAHRATTAVKPPGVSPPLGFIGGS